MSQIYSGTKTQVKKLRQGNHNNYNSNQRNTNNLRLNQPDSQNRNNYNQKKNHNWNQGTQFNPQYCSIPCGKR